jgi:hypothetical protein
MGELTVSQARDNLAELIDTTTGIGADVNADSYRIEGSGDGFTASDYVAKIYGAITLYRLTGATVQFGAGAIGLLS